MTPPNDSLFEKARANHDEATKAFFAYLDDHPDVDLSDAAQASRDFITRKAFETIAEDLEMAFFVASDTALARAYGEAAMRIRKGHPRRGKDKGMSDFSPEPGWFAEELQTAAASKNRVATLEAENARLQGAIFAHHERYDQLKLWCDGEIEQHHMLTADIQRLQGELEQAQANEVRAHNEWTEAVLELRKQLAEAQAEVVRLREAILSLAAFDGHYGGCLGCDEAAERDAETEKCFHIRALLATPSGAVESLERRLKAADELADAVDNDVGFRLDQRWPHRNLIAAMAAYRAASGNKDAQ